MANYVKFLRGTKAAWNAITTKDSDTLYFIYDNKDSTSGLLYLGNKLISGGSGSTTITGATTLSELTDTLISSSIDPNSLLIYDETQGKWVNKKPSEVLSLISSVLVGATSSANGVSGLVPAPAAGDQNKFLKGDGTWSTVVATLSDADIATINGLSTTVGTLVGTDTNKSVREIALDVLTDALIPEDAKDSLDTLQEISAWIQSHPDDISDINSRLQTIEGDLYDTKDPDTGEVTVEGLKTKVGNLTALYTTLQGAVSGNTTDIATIYALLEWKEIPEPTTEE